jgi:hypothetical protein
MSERAYRIVIIGAMLVGLAGCGAFVYGKLARYEQATSVTGLTWKRVQPIEEFRVLHEDTLRSWVPSDAYDIYYYTDCDTTCDTDDDGNRRCETDCDDRARYKINRWRWAFDLVNTGRFDQEQTWPTFQSDTGEWIGAKRTATRYELLYVHFLTVGQLPITYTANDQDDWRRFLAGQAFTIELNRFDEPIWDSLRLLDKR